MEESNNVHREPIRVSKCKAIAIFALLDTTAPTPVLLYLKHVQRKDIAQKVLLFRKYARTALILLMVNS